MRAGAECPSGGCGGLSRLAALATVFVLALAHAIPARAHDYKFGDIEVGHLWTPPFVEGEGVPVYGPLLNIGARPAELVGAASPIAAQVRIRVKQEGGYAWRDTVELRPGHPVSLAPWGTHLWLTGVDHPLEDGESFTLTLDFGEAGRHTVEVVVERQATH